MEYLISFLYIHPVVHSELVRVNTLEIRTDAATLSDMFQRRGLPDYITTERVFEWYQCLLETRNSRNTLIVMREDSLGDPLVTFAPSVWSTCFIRRRLERLAANDSEVYRL